MSWSYTTCSRLLHKAVSWDYRQDGPPSARARLHSVAHCGRGQAPTCMTCRLTLDLWLPQVLFVSRCEAANGAHLRDLPADGGPVVDAAVQHHVHVVRRGRPHQVAQLEVHDGGVHRAVVAPKVQQLGRLQQQQAPSVSAASAQPRT